jgi:hypothetical protein
VPIRTFDDVDWTDNPLQQVAFYQAVKQVARQPTVTIGNASTYLHLMLGAVGTFEQMMVALHDAPVSSPRDGRSYWEGVPAHVPQLSVFRQDAPGEWSYVSENITQRLVSYFSSG